MEYLEERETRSRPGSVSGKTVCSWKYFGLPFRSYAHYSSIHAIVGRTEGLVEACLTVVN